MPPILANAAHDTACVVGTVGCMSAANGRDWLSIILPPLIAAVFAPLASVIIRALDKRLQRWASGGKDEK